jgi:hypothetical protein
MVMKRRRIRTKGWKRRRRKKGKKNEMIEK